MVFKKSNLNTASAERRTEKEKQIGVKYIVIGTIWSEPSMLTKIGKSAAITNKIACFENMPEFFIENFIK